MKRVATWALYAVGALAVAYLALYAYVAFTGRPFEPGDPIHIFRKPDAPNYSAATDAGENPQWLYTVVFDGTELWGPDSDASVKISVDAFEPYLEKA